MNREIEIKLEINKEIYQVLVDKFTNMQLKHIEKFQNDIYFSPQATPFFGGNIDDECLRIRVLKDKNILSYKKIFFGQNSDDIHLEEHEVEVDDLEQMKSILKALHIDEVLTLKKLRHIFIYQNIFEIALDKVDDLGYFVEIEVKDENLSVIAANAKLKEVVLELGLDKQKRNLDGYANLLYDELYKNNC